MLILLFSGLRELEKSVNKTKETKKKKIKPSENSSADEDQGTYCAYWKDILILTPQLQRSGVKILQNQIVITIMSIIIVLNYYRQNAGGPQVYVHVPAHLK